MALAVVASAAWIVTWIAVGLPLGGELSASRLLAGVAGGIAFATAYYLLARRRGER